MGSGWLLPEQKLWQMLCASRYGSFVVARTRLLLNLGRNHEVPLSHRGRRYHLNPGQIGLVQGIGCEGMIRFAEAEGSGIVAGRNWVCVAEYECFRTSSKAVDVGAVKLMWFAVAVAAAGVAVTMLGAFRCWGEVRQWFLCEGGTGRRLE